MSQRDRGSGRGSGNRGNRGGHGGRGRGYTYFTSVDGRVFLDRRDALAGNSNFDNTGGRSPCQDPDALSGPDPDPQ